MLQSKFKNLKFLSFVLTSGVIIKSYIENKFFKFFLKYLYLKIQLFLS